MRCLMLMLSRISRRRSSCARTSLFVSESISYAIRTSRSPNCTIDCKAAGTFFSAETPGTEITLHPVISFTIRAFSGPSMRITSNGFGVGSVAKFLPDQQHQVSHFVPARIPFDVRYPYFGIEAFGWSKRTWYPWILPSPEKLGIKKPESGSLARLHSPFSLMPNPGTPRRSRPLLISRCGITFADRYYG